MTCTFIYISRLYIHNLCIYFSPAMNFFKSVFSDDPENSDTETTPPSSPNSQSQPSPSPNPNPDVAAITNAWSFGSSLIKTLASKSESVIETYRRDLEEFSSGLKKETAVIRQVASRAVKDLPTSLEAGTAVAQESLESVGRAVHNLGNTVGEIISHGKETILDDDSDSEFLDGREISSGQLYNDNASSKPYSRVDAQIRSVQCDMKTYLEEVEDLDEYNEWKLGFVLDDKVDEIEDLISENGAIEEIYNEIVPGKVDEEVFWSRYFYRVYKVKKAEEARSKIVKRAIAGEEEEELSWDVDEDEYEKSDGSKMMVGGPKEQTEEKNSQENDVGKKVVEIEPDKLDRGNDDQKESCSESRLPESESESHDYKLEAKNNEKNSLDGKTDKDSDISAVSSQPSREEEDLGWDEIEDVDSVDETKVGPRGSPNKADLHKRLSAAEEEEDLTWDIEDDDEPFRS